MDSDLIKKVLQVKKLLRESPSSLSFGIIEDGLNDDLISQNKKLFIDSNEKVYEYVDFIKDVSGFSLGSIVLFDFPRIHEFQNLLDFLPDWEKNWLCIGKIMSEPMGINKNDGSVNWFSEIPYDDEGMNLGTFNNFMKEYVFGEKYSEIVPWVDEDEWYQFMIKNKLITKGDSDE
ncbi:hypothetical protein EDM57_22405 [Brevibacillus gelatini]|uniref:SMI1/KNR4 family protein n=1 Tax=Brevibacillus gelatini TaxID=1655277 RepID=A0A3M8ALE5_9BACL|nr:hypothetical protein [Brevibacillus gelatini]RNB51437.1 hypothetical protein EDM57_22405 [Brevibacillus gelatini]